MPLAEVVFEVPAGGALGQFTLDHADTRALVRLMALEEGAARALVTLAGPTELTAELVRALRAELADPDFEVLSITPYSVVLRARVPLDAAAWAAAGARFVDVFGRDTLLEPSVVEAGKVRVRGVAVQQMDIRAALEKLQVLQRAGGWAGFKVVHVREFDPKAFGDRSSPLLEPEQEELVRLALAMGYYDTPRRCSLEDIAVRVGLSVSPVHKKLKDVEHTLIRAHLQPDAPREPRRKRAARARSGPPRGLLREVSLRVVPRAFGPATFTKHHTGARVVYQPLADEPGVASHLYVVLAAAPAAAEFLAQVERDPSVLGSEILSRDAEHVSLKVRRRPTGGSDDPLQAVQAALGRDAYLKPAVAEDGAVLGRVVVLRRLGEQELAATLQELAASSGWDHAELVGVRDVGVEGELLALPRAEKMTGRQEEVLRIAHALGYYATPRGCTLEDVAATLGISANAVHKNLTAAEQRIIQSHVAGTL
jgi:predicted DNA binding protein